MVQMLLHLMASSIIKIFSRQKRFVEVGGGDAFGAGFLYGFLNNMNTQTCLQYGAAVAAFKYSLAGDMPLVDLKQIQQIIMPNSNSDVTR